jgi:hypothetical protein
MSDNELNHHGQATHLPRETSEHLYQRLVDTIKGTRILIHDAQYTLAEYDSKIGWGHSAIEDVIEMAAAADVDTFTCSITIPHVQMQTSIASCNSAAQRPGKRAGRC